MLINRKEIFEIYSLKHRHDNNDQFVDYESKILNSSLSPYMYENDLMNSWLNKMQSLISLFFDQFNIIKNFKNYNVDKYEFKHSK